MISLIIPVYNEAPYLKRCLDSVLRDCKVTGRQEVIVVDDGSTDGSGKICDQYKGKFKIYHTENKGVSHARNFGIDKATGDYITFLDADDEWLPSSFKTMNSVSSLGFNLIQFNHYRYYKAIDKTVMKYQAQKGWYSAVFINDLPKGWCFVWNKLIKTSLISDNNIRFPEGIQYGEDEIFSLKALFAAKRIRQIPQGLIKRHFENKQSLAHIVDKSGLETQIVALKQLLAETSDSTNRRLIAQIISEHKSNLRRKYGQ